LSKYVIHPILQLLAIAVAAGSFWGLWRFGVFPTLVSMILPALFIGSAFFVAGYYLVRAGAKGRKNPRTYPMPIEKVAQQIRDLLGSTAPGLSRSNGWEELRDSRRAEIDSDGFLMLSFNCIYQDVNYSGMYSRGEISGCALQQDVLLQELGDSTQVELIFHFREDNETITTDLLEYRTRKYLDNALKSASRLTAFQ